MRILILCVIVALIIQQSFAEKCECHCCTANGCLTRLAGSFDRDPCTDSSCTKNECIARFFDKCPDTGTFGENRPICNGTSKIQGQM